MQGPGRLGPGRNAGVRGGTAKARKIFKSVLEKFIRNNQC